MRRKQCARTSKRGSRADISARLKANPYKPVNSLVNKMDYIRLDLTTQRKVKDCNTIILTKTWLNNTVLDNAIQVDGPTTFWVDRTPALNGKLWGSGIFVNNNRCTNAKIISSHCSEDIEFLTVKCRPFYIPREFTAINITAMYIQPSASTKDTVYIVSVYQLNAEL